MSKAEKKPAEVKLVIQQCLSGTLKLPSDEVLEIDQGMVIFVCFLKGANEASATKAAEIATALRLCENEEGSKRSNILESGGEVLVIPQATLGGKLKGKSLQYHTNIDKTEGEALYESFCSKLDALVGAEKVKRGVYGARQVLATQTNGPYTHVFEL